MTKKFVCDVLATHGYSLRNSYISRKHNMECYEFIDLQHEMITTILFKPEENLYYGVVQEVTSKVNKPPVLRFDKDYLVYSDLDILLNELTKKVDNNEQWQQC